MWPSEKVLGKLCLPLLLLAAAGIVLYMDDKPILPTPCQYLYSVCTLFSICEVIGKLGCGTSLLFLADSSRLFEGSEWKIYGETPDKLLLTTVSIIPKPDTWCLIHLLRWSSLSQWSSYLTGIFIFLFFWLSPPQIFLYIGYHLYELLLTEIYICVLEQVRWWWRRTCL